MCAELKSLHLCLNHKQTIVFSPLSPASPTLPRPRPLSSPRQGKHVTSVSGVGGAGLELRPGRDQRLAPRQQRRRTEICFRRLFGPHRVDRSHLSRSCGVSDKSPGGGLSRCEPGNPSNDSDLKEHGLNGRLTNFGRQ